MWCGRLMKLTPRIRSYLCQLYHGWDIIYRQEEHANILSMLSQQKQNQHSEEIAEHFNREEEEHCKSCEDLETGLYQREKKNLVCN